MKKITLQKIQSMANNLIAETFEGMDEKEIEAELRKGIGKGIEFLLLKNLGLRRGWSDQLEVDSYGVFDKAFKEVNKEAINKCANQLYSEFLNNAVFSLSDKEKASLVKKAHDTYVSYLNEHIESLIMAEAIKDGDDFFKEYLDKITGEEEE